MIDQNKIQIETGLKRFFETFKKSLVEVTKITVCVIFVLALLATFIFSWYWGLCKATANNYLYILIPIGITILIFTIIKTLEDF